MTPRSHSAAIGTNPGAANPGIKNAGTVSIQADLLQCVKTLFPHKAWAHLADFLGLSERGAKHRLAGTRRFTADELCLLLQTDHGFKILTAAMADANPMWWRICRPLMEVAEVQQMQIKANRKLNKAIKDASDADRAIAATIGRADALLVQDEEFYRGHSRAVRHSAGVVDSAVEGPNQRRR